MKRVLVALCLANAWLLPVVGRAAFTFTKITDDNTQAPTENLGFTYDTFGRPSIHNGWVTYRAATLSPGFGIRAVDRANPSNQLFRVLKVDPSIGAQTILTDPSTSLSDVAFKVVPPSGGSQPNEYYTNGNTIIQAAIGAGAPQIYDGNIVFARTGAGAAARNINLIGFNATDNNPTTFAGVAVDGNDLVPGGGGAKFFNFSDYLDHNITKNPAVQNRSIVFHGGWDNFVDVGIYRWDQQNDSINVIADKNVTIPGLGGTFNQGFAFQTTHVENNQQIGPPGGASQENSARPSLYGTSVAFSYDNLSTKSGVYIHNNGTVKTIADTNTTNPSFNDTFGRFFEVSTIGSVTAFVATGDSSFSLGGEIGHSGLYLQHCGKIIEVMREGEILNGTDVTNLQLSHRGLNVANSSKLRPTLELAFRATFAGTPPYPEGIFKTSTSLLCYSMAVGYGGGSGTGTALVTTPLGSPSFDAPVFDDSARLRVSMDATYGAGLEGIFGGDMAADLYGVDSLPGNNPTLIDFSLDGGNVVPETMVLRFNQDVTTEEIQLVGFDPDDSAIIEVDGVAIHADGITHADGFVPLGGRLLREGSEVRISWDPANSVGDGFSFNNLAFIAVPEPNGFLTGVAAMFSFNLGRRRTAV